MDLIPQGSKELKRAWLFAARGVVASGVESWVALHQPECVEMLTGEPPRLLGYDLRADK
jgi:hypothetical protein